MSSLSMSSNCERDTNRDSGKTVSKTEGLADSATTQRHFINNDTNSASLKEQNIYINDIDSELYYIGMN